MKWLDDKIEVLCEKIQIEQNLVSRRKNVIQEKVRHRVSGLGIDGMSRTIIM